MTTNLSAVPVARRPAVDLLWRALGGRRAGIALAVTFTVALALGNLLPQLPPDAATDAGERTRWLVTTALAYGQWGTLFQRLGLFDVARAPWWEGLLAAGFCHALLRLADAAERAWRYIRPQPAPPAAWPHARYVSTEAAHTLEAIRTRLGQSADTVAMWEPADGVTVWRVTRRAWSRWAQGSAWLGLALLLVWALLGETGAWRVGNLSLPPDQAVPLGQGTGLSLQLTAQGDAYAVAWQRGDETLTQMPLAPRRPATYDGIGLHWRGDGPMLTVTGADADGEPLTFEVVGGEAAGQTAQLIFDQTAEQSFAVPAYGLAFRALVTPDGGWQVEAYHSGEESPFFTTALADAQTLPIEEATYTFTPARFVQVTAQHTPWFPLLPLAGLLLVAGVGLHLGFPASALWVRATPAGSGMWFEWATEGALPDGWLHDLLPVGQTGHG